MATTVHRRRPRAEWQRLFDQQRRSGLTVAEFCLRERLYLPTFRWWQSRLRATRDGSGALRAPAGAGAFLPVAVRGTAETGSGVIELLIQGDERRVRIAHDCPPALAVAVTAALRDERCS
jgi:hypothetical protein